MTQQTEYKPQGITRVTIEVNLEDGTIAKAERISPNVTPANFVKWIDNFYDNFMEQFDPRANCDSVETYIIGWDLEDEDSENENEADEKERDGEWLTEE